MHTHKSLSAGHSTNLDGRGKNTHGRELCIEFTFAEQRAKSVRIGKKSLARRIRSFIFSQTRARAYVQIKCVGCKFTTFLHHGVNREAFMFSEQPRYFYFLLGWCSNIRCALNFFVLIFFYLGMVSAFVINLHGVLTTTFKLGVKTACDYKWYILTYQWLLYFARRAIQLLLNFCCKFEIFFAGSYKKAMSAMKI